MLPPDSTFKKWWNIVMSILVLCNTLFIILVICFKKYDARGLYWYRYRTAPRRGERRVRNRSCVRFERAACVGAANGRRVEH